MDIKEAVVELRKKGGCIYDGVAIVATQKELLWNDDKSLEYFIIAQSKKEDK